MARSALTLTLAAVLTSCGAAPSSVDGGDPTLADGGTWTPGDYDLALIDQVGSWRAVLPTTYPGTGGHSGQRVRVFFNPEAAPTYEATSGPVRFAVGSIIAKVVVAQESTPLADASRVYFMRKEPAGYDPGSADWSWAVANRSGSTWSFSVEGRSSLCTGCHQAESAWDYARTVQVFRTQTPP